MLSKRQTLIGLGITALLLIPLVAMQFTAEVHWTLFDFAVAAVLLFGAGLLIDITTRRINQSKYRFAIYAIVIIALALIWAELGVGIFGTPFAGD